MSDILVEISDVDFSYGSSPLIENLNLIIYKGDFIGVAGANGSGKTTLVKLLLGELKPLRGTITHRCAGAISYLPQYAAIDKRFPISVREVVETGLLARCNLWRPRLTASEQARVSAIIDRLGLTPLQGKSVGQLSGGQLQRTMLARALVSSPRLLLLDEPDTYLDSATEKRLFELLCEVACDCAIVLVTHDAHTISSYCNRVVTLGRP